VILLIPALIIFPRFWQMDGILLSTPFADFLSFLMTALWFLTAMKKLDQGVVSEPVPEPIKESN
jgi:Na+-driven multidrug efflux pump